MQQHDCCRCFRGQVERDILNAKAEATAAGGDAENQLYWRVEERQLREKERQLRGRALLLRKDAGCSARGAAAGL